VYRLIFWACSLPVSLNEKNPGGGRGFFISLFNYSWLRGTDGTRGLAGLARGFEIQALTRFEGEAQDTLEAQDALITIPKLATKNHIFSEEVNEGRKCQQQAQSQQD
jgi:hypothetical protein